MTESASEPPSAAGTPPPTAPRHDPYAALRFRDFRLLIGANFLAMLGDQMVSVAVGWELYERTHDALALGLVGLVEVLPVILLVLPAGHVADRFNRKYVVLDAQALITVCALGLALLSLAQGPLLLIYACLLGIGTARSFNFPARSALLSQTVPPAVFSSAATWSSSGWQLAAVVGPGLGGLAIALAHSAAPIYLFDVAAGVLVVSLVALIRGTRQARLAERRTLSAMLVGLGFVWRSRVILAAITLDLFAVLLGGATFLLPIYAQDILGVGAAGLGWLRAAPSIGAILVVLIVSRRPPFKRAGRALLWAVAGFGAATIVFGLSTNFWLSLAMLMLLGALDNISVVIRTSLLLIYTPDAMRGRVSAINSLFVGASNELGGFESGVAAALFGPVAAVVLGGVGTILVVLAVALIWPQVRKLGRLGEPVSG